MKNKIIKLALIVTSLLINKKTILAAQYIWPIDKTNAYETRIEYGYGKRAYNSNSYNQLYNYAPYEQTYNRYENHYGVDISGIKGHTYNVVSVVDGTVLTTSLDQSINPSINYIDRNKRSESFDGGGYGNYIVIKETSTGRCFLYGHLKANSIIPKKGEKVYAGQKIAIMGSSGDSGHMHLHFEVRPNQTKVLPSWGFNLVPTYTYGVETLNPVSFIGTEPPKKIDEQKQKEEQERKQKEEQERKQKEEQERKLKEEQERKLLDEKRAKMLQVITKETSSYIRIYITFNKNIEVISTPTLYISSNNGLQEATYEGKYRKNIITYTFKYEDFNPTSYGKIYASLVGGQIVNSDDTSIDAKYLFQGRYIATLEQMTISEQILSKYKNLGDINLDNSINSIDASLALKLSKKIATNKALTEDEKQQQERADVNGDGKIDINDALAILEYYSNQATIKEKNIFNKIIYCDFNNDNVIDSKDYELLKKSKSQEYTKKYDLNNDNTIDENDLNEFKNILKKYGTR